MKETRYALVRTSARLVELVRLLGDGRWLCTDHEQQCHPCYNMRDLVLLPSMW